MSRYVGLRSSAEKLGVEMAVPLAAATRLLVLPFELPASAVGLNHLVAEERSAVPEADDLGPGCIGLERVDQIRPHVVELT